jgi:hypothetical protein
MTLTSLPPAPPPAWLLIGLLILASAGCTRRDWVGDMLVLTDVSGTWSSVGPPPSFTLRLQQSGARVTGESLELEPEGTTFVGQTNGRVEGLVNGDVLTFTILGSGTVRGVVTIDGDEATGELTALVSFRRRCPCEIRLRRTGPAPTPRPQP